MPMVSGGVNRNAGSIDVEADSSRSNEIVGAQYAI